MSRPFAGRVLIMSSSAFTVIKKDKESQARLGVLKTPHGIVYTPSYVIVATHAAIKCLKPSDIKKTKTQIVISNTYHLWEKILNPKSEILDKSKILNPKLETFLLKNLGTKMPVMTDSGGFQVFSLGFGLKERVGKILNAKPTESQTLNRRKNIKITGKGVYFTIEGKKRFLGPELSMKIQKKLGADIIFAFDECTSPLDNFKYNERALKRTHRWGKICLKTRDPRQMIFGIVQGGKYKALREKSAKFIGSLPFDGFGIGGSFGKDEMTQTLKWVIPYLPEDKPRHLLGIGKIEDIFNAIENGVDLFDCVIPTREARHGRIYTHNGYYDIRKNYDTSKNHKKDIGLENNCRCLVCAEKTTRGYVRALFKGSPKEKLAGQRLATIHNVWFFNNLIEQIRSSIKKDKFLEFKKKILG